MEDFGLLAIEIIRNGLIMLPKPANGKWVLKFLTTNPFNGIDIAIKSFASKSLRMVLDYV